MSLGDLWDELKNAVSTDWNYLTDTYQNLGEGLASLPSDTGHMIDNLLSGTVTPGQALEAAAQDYKQRYTHPLSGFRENPLAYINDALMAYGGAAGVGRALDNPGVANTLSRLAGEEYGGYRPSYGPDAGDARLAAGSQADPAEAAFNAHMQRLQAERNPNEVYRGQFDPYEVADARRGLQAEQPQSYYHVTNRQNGPSILDEGLRGSGRSDFGEADMRGGGVYFHPEDTLAEMIQSGRISPDQLIFEVKRLASQATGHGTSGDLLGTGRGGGSTAVRFSGDITPEDIVNVYNHRGEPIPGMAVADVRRPSTVPGQDLTAWEKLIDSVTRKGGRGVTDAGGELTPAGQAIREVLQGTSLRERIPGEPYTEAPRLQDPRLNDQYAQYLENKFRQTNEVDRLMRDTGGGEIRPAGHVTRSRIEYNSPSGAVTKGRLGESSPSQTLADFVRMVRDRGQGPTAFPARKPLSRDTLREQGQNEVPWDMYGNRNSGIGPDAGRGSRPYPGQRPNSVDDILEAKGGARPDLTHQDPFEVARAAAEQRAAYEVMQGTRSQVAETLMHSPGRRTRAVDVETSSLPRPESAGRSTLDRLRNDLHAQGNDIDLGMFRRA